MKKIMNDPRNFVDEMLDGLCLANPELKRIGEHGRAIVRAAKSRNGKVGVVSGGGSGHLPLFTGYVGEGLLDACAIGNVFEGPTVDSCMDTIKAADDGAGVLCLYGNYGGDRMNFDMATEFAEADGFETRTVLGTDDVASARPEESEKRRGVAGIILAYKTAGARANEGAGLDEVAAIARHTIACTRTIGIALSPCKIPGAAAAFEIGDDEIEMGMGIHGEPGIWRNSLKSADRLADEMVERLLAERPAGASDKLAILVNSLGATPLEELFIMYRRIVDRLSKQRLGISYSLVGPYVTSMEMAGMSLSICFLDDKIEALLRKPADCPFWKVV